MKRARLLALATMAIFVLGAVAAVAASAENVEILPVPTAKEPLQFESKAVGNSFVEGEVAGSALECTSVTSKGEFTSASLGTGTIDFTGCKSPLNGAKCNSLGDGAGVILVVVDWHLVDVLLPAGHPLPELMLGLAAILLALLHLECSATILELLGNNVMGEFVKMAASGTKTKTGEVNFETTKGVQEVKECDFDKAFCFKEATHKTFGLYLELGKGREKAGLQLAAEVTLQKEAAFDY